MGGLRERGQPAPTERERTDGQLAHSSRRRATTLDGPTRGKEGPAQAGKEAVVNMMRRQTNLLQPPEASPLGQEGEKPHHPLHLTNSHRQKFLRSPPGQSFGRFPNLSQTQWAYAVNDTPPCLKPTGPKLRKRPQLVSNPPGPSCVSSSLSSIWAQVESNVPNFSPIHGVQVWNSRPKLRTHL